MYAQLGTIAFVNLKGFTSYSKSGSATFAEHALLDGKPVLQRTGNTLDELSITMRFNAGFPCVPTEEVEKLKSSRDAGEVLPLSWGNGKVEGNYVITDLSETIEEQDAEGNIFSIVVNCTLREFSTVNKLQQQQEQNRKKAAAVGNKNPVAKKRVNPATCPQSISGIISNIESYASKVNSIIVKQSGLLLILNGSEVQRSLAAIILLCDDLVKRGTDPQSCAYKYQEIQRNATMVKGDSAVLNNTIATNQVFRLQPDNKLLQQRVAALKSSAQPLINQAITRQ